MKLNLLATSIEYLKGVGQKKADLLKKELDIHTFEDLLNFFPFKYYDRSIITPLNEINDDLYYVQCAGAITQIEIIDNKKNGRKRLVAQFTDGTSTIELIWFQGLKWIKDKLKVNQKYVVFGRVSRTNLYFSIAHPEIELYDEFIKKPYSSGLQPVYHSTEKLKSAGLDSKGIGRLVSTLLEQVLPNLEETLPENIIKNLRFPSNKEMYQNLHFPRTLDDVTKAERRMKFEEIFYYQLAMQKARADREQKNSGLVFTKVGEFFNEFYKILPFNLTNSQKRVIREIWEDCKSGRQLNRLLQGDVGSGKTVVALSAMLIAIGNGYQSCMMAPTEILATQHYNTITKLLNGLPLRVELLTGSTRNKKRNEILNDLAEGKVNILIGTHALIEDNVKFQNLGFVVIDEQHRFGVAQRAKLWEKNEKVPHVLVMTATPIPRTLALTVYGDLDVSVINEFPGGPKNIKTLHFTDRQRLIMYDIVRQQIDAGRQVYFVYPLINESDKLELRALMEEYDTIAREFPLPKYKIGIVHGLLKASDKDFTMQRFSRGEINILVATTVIEVGVDVPNATVMVIENAERFGLSQLHQLRGRIGRGEHKSYCILMTKDELNEAAKIRIETMLRTLDGFKISEIDLKLRGMGDVHGTQQSGHVPFKKLNLATDHKIITYAHKLAREIIETDPKLNTPDNLILQKVLNKKKQGQVFWSQIS